jgi:hypothetical protein
MDNSILHHYIFVFETKYDSSIDRDTIQDYIAKLLVYHKCKDIVRRIDSSIIFNSTISFLDWFNELLNYFGNYLVFDFCEIKLENNKSSYKVNGFQAIKEKESRQYQSMIQNLRETNLKILFDDLNDFKNGDYFPHSYD